MPRHPEFLEHGGKRVGAGRHPFFNDRTLKQFRKLLLECVGMPRAEILRRIKQKFHVDLSIRLFRKYCELVNAPFVKVPASPPLSDRTRQRRIAFARKFVRRKGWLDFIATDEKSFKSYPSSVHAHVPIASGVSIPRVAHPLSINVWWAASGRYTAEPVLYTSSLNGTRYANILHKNLRPLLQRSQNRCHLIQDNLRAHLTAECRRFFKNNRVILCDDFPPYSPDLQPIENWWDIAQQEVYHLAPTTIAQLRVAVLAGLKKVTTAVRKATLLGMPRRLKFVLEHNGAHSGH